MGFRGLRNSAGAALMATYPVLAQFHMGLAQSAWMLDNDADQRDHHLGCYAALLGISYGRALARFNMQIVGAI